MKNNYIKKIYFICFDEDTEGACEERYREEITAEDLTIEYAYEFLCNVETDRYRSGVTLIRQYFLNEECLEDEDPFYESALTSYSDRPATKNEIKKFVKELKTESEIYPEFFYTKKLDVDKITTLSDTWGIYEHTLDIIKTVEKINRFLRKNKDFYIQLGVNFFIDGQPVDVITSYKITREITVDDITDFIKNYGGKIREY